MNVKRWMLGWIKTGESVEEFYARTTFSHRLFMIERHMDNRLDGVKTVLALKTRPKPEVVVHPSQYDVGYKDGYKEGFSEGYHAGR